MLDLRPYDAVLFDLDGTIWHEDVPLPGAIELIHALQRRDQPIAFISNSGATPRELARRLDRMGASVDPARIYSASMAACDYVIDHYAVGTRAFNVANDAVVELLGGHVIWIDDEADADVVLSAGLWHERATIDRLQKALRKLRRGATLIALCADRSYPTPRGLEIGAGGVAAMLAYAAGVTPVYCGKPQPIFFEELCAHLNIDPARSILIGDNLEADIAGANAVGMQSVLTLTGITTRQDLDRLTNPIRPTHIITDLSECE